MIQLYKFNLTPRFNQSDNSLWHSRCFLYRGSLRDTGRRARERHASRFCGLVYVRLCWRYPHQDDKYPRRKYDVFLFPDERTSCLICWLFRKTWFNMSEELSWNEGPMPKSTGLTRRKSHPEDKWISVVFYIPQSR